MEKIVVSGGRPLQGKITVSGAKNAVLPIIAASLLAEGECRIYDAPRLTDVDTICDVLKYLGAKVTWEGNCLVLDASNITTFEAPYELVRKMRASFLVMGPLLARLGQAKTSLPGGCAIGTRPIDLHLKGLAALGAGISMGHGVIGAKAEKLVGNRVYLDFPSVGATENIMMAACLAEGTTIIENAAEEPEIVDLANFLNGMGAKVAGAGTNIIKIEGVQTLHGTNHTVIPDRIEAGTYMILTAATGSEIVVQNVIVDHLKPVMAKLEEAGATLEEEEDGLRIRASNPVEAVDIKTLPYPGFPTDLQAQMMALMTTAKGTSVITETVFENRFMHVNEFRRMGAKIVIEGHSAVVKGTDKLTGAPVKATDLRAGAALLVAGLMAEGDTEIYCVHHIDRGYENIVEKLQNLGAQIKRVHCSDDRKFPND